MKLRIFIRTFKIVYRYNKMLDTLRIMKRNLRLLKRDISRFEQTTNTSKSK